MNKREQELTALAAAVLEKKIERPGLAGLSATVVYKLEYDLIGFVLSVPHPTKKGYQVAASPSVRTHDATTASLSQAFDEGLEVINKAVEADKEKN